MTKQRISRRVVAEIIRNGGDPRALQDAGSDTLPYGHWLQQRFESWSRKHFHEVSTQQYVVGNGSFVMKVCKPTKQNPRGAVAFIGENGVNERGERFAYADYFLPEELAV